ncbi:hypothetical protein TNIN_259561 [Trichonephila inaurata madagascariensis]|uniref:Uncharacterized protein n=1 Tax=Trichonephila inaurata madagascariensis TaxID=2747483 RepID=A0A8X7C0X5_9ARAC|nr:hypothetical protein TNIN_259561 [Trichonephila inaurata madagascariensis]
MVLPSSADVKGRNFLGQKPRGDSVYHCKLYLTSWVFLLPIKRQYHKGKTMERDCTPGSFVLLMRARNSDPIMSSLSGDGSIDGFSWDLAILSVG